MRQVRAVWRRAARQEVSFCEGRVALVAEGGGVARMSRSNWGSATMRSIGRGLMILGLILLYLAIPLAYDVLTRLARGLSWDDPQLFLIQLYQARATDHLILLIIMPLVAMLVGLLARRYGAGWWPLLGASGTLLIVSFALAKVSIVEVVGSIAVQVLLYSAILTWPIGEDLR